ncbi:MAG: hypothetical protein FJY73_09265 [Candidatus Eisenbacteria bacterium]|nr:hypothetical protein [Candidatus Eisenbacteria bacterium]
MSRARAGALFALLFVSCGARERPLVLYDFETEKDLDRISWACHDHFSLTDEWSASGLRALRCELPRATYPGVRFLDFENDWRGFEALALAVRNEGAETIELVVRVDDRDSGEEFGNRYNGSFSLFPGENSIRIPLEKIRRGPASRALDLSHIDQFLIFLHDIDDPPVILVDRIALE